MWPGLVWVSSQHGGGVSRASIPTEQGAWPFLPRLVCNIVSLLLHSVGEGNHKVLPKFNRLSDSYFPPLDGRNVKDFVVIIFEKDNLPLHSTRKPFHQFSLIVISPPCNWAIEKKILVGFTFASPHLPPVSSIMSYFQKGLVRICAMNKCIISKWINKGMNKWMRNGLLKCLHGAWHRHLPGETGAPWRKGPLKESWFYCSHIPPVCSQLIQQSIIYV